MTPVAAVAWLHEAARYFERRPASGDGAYWSNVYNAENCRKIAALLSPATAALVDREQDDRRKEAREDPKSPHQRKEARG